MVFDRFIDLAFTGSDPLFDGRILYLPGNHDHHLWETARERQYSNYVASVDPAKPLLPPWHVTRMFEDPSAPLPEAELLTALVRRRAGPNVCVNIIYPNLGLASADGSRIVIVHHGHFAEPLYGLMSTAKAALFPGQVRGPEIWDWEADNFAWIDFFWSTLGRSGDAGKDVGLIYDMLQSPPALARLADNLVVAATDNWVPGPLRPFVRSVAPRFVRRTARRVGTRERSDPAVVLSQSTRSGLSTYITGPLLRQLKRERPTADTAAVSFVFGHTHKPFESLEDFAGFAKPVSVYNTGGWVVDTEHTAPVQGAAVILVDDECRVVSLRLYNQSNDASSYRVSLVNIEAEDSSDLRSRLASTLDLASPPWSEFSAAAAAAVTQRHRLLPQIILRGIELAGKPGRG